MIAKLRARLNRSEVITEIDDAMGPTVGRLILAFLVLAGLFIAGSLVVGLIALAGKVYETWGAGWLAVYLAVVIGCPAVVWKVVKP